MQREYPMPQKIQFTHYPLFPNFQHTINLEHLSNRQKSSTEIATVVEGGSSKFRNNVIHNSNPKGFTRSFFTEYGILSAARDPSAREK